MIDKDELDEKGYIIVKNFFSYDEIIKMRKIILFEMKYKKNMMIIGNGGSKPNFLCDKNFQNLIPLLRLNDIHGLMKTIFEAPFHLCFHNDIGINRIVNWHKDTLNNQYKIYQKTNIWNDYEGEKHEIYKFLIYMQNHSKDNFGLYVIEGSHKNPEIFIDQKKIKYVGVEIGDVIIFNQKITHRGQKYDSLYTDRILLSLGFGKNNIFTREFEEGTIHRQNDQNKMIKTTIL